MFYDRAIHYLNLYKGEEKQGCCGFVKLEQRDTIFRYEIMINRGPDGTFSGSFRGGAMNKAIGSITLQSGRGTLRGTFSTQPQPVDSHFDGVVFDLGQGVAAGALWRQTDTAEKEELTERKGNPEITERTEEKELKGEEESEEARETEIEPASLQPAEKEEPAAEKIKAGAEKPGTSGIAETKWEQLWKIYPHRSPFDDEREYLLCSPSDFLVLSEESYSKAGNTFLLHGYYTYGYLLLGKTEKNKEPVYFIGVPGSFVEKESKIALYYGFESFEAKQEPAKIGDFGYYCLPVTI